MVSREIGRSSDGARGGAGVFGSAGTEAKTADGLRAQRTICPRRPVTIGFEHGPVVSAIYIVIALGDVVEDAARCPRLVDGVAGTLARSAEFALGDGIVSWIGITRPNAPVLVHECLNGGHDGRSGRSAPDAKPSAGSTRARGAAVGGVRVANNHVMPPEA